MGTGSGTKQDVRSAYRSEMQRYALWGEYWGISFFSAVLIAVSGSIFGPITNAPRLVLLSLQIWPYLLALAVGYLWWRNTHAFVSNKATYINSLGSREEVE